MTGYPQASSARRCTSNGGAVAFPAAARRRPAGPFCPGLQLWRFRHRAVTDNWSFAPAIGTPPELAPGLVRMPKAGEMAAAWAPPIATLRRSAPRRQKLVSLWIPPSQSSAVFFRPQSDLRDLQVEVDERSGRES